jgi:Tfp pilus assembly protein PilF
LDRAKALDPTCSDVWLTRAQCLQGDSAKKAEALESYTRGVALAVAAAQAKHRAVVGPPPPTPAEVEATAAAAAAAAAAKAHEDIEEGARRAGVAAVGCGVWTNLGCLQHEHGKLAAARRSYMNALEADYMQHEAGLDQEVQIRNIHV